LCNAIAWAKKQSGFSSMFSKKTSQADFESAPGTRMSSGRPAPFTILAVLCILAYLPPLLELALGSWPFTDDAVGLMSAWRGFARMSLVDGILPLWNPQLYCGIPFMSNGQTAVLYPPNVVYWTLPMPLAMLADAMLHNLLLAFGTYSLARALGLSRGAATLSAVALGFSGAVSAHIATGHMTWHAARAYVPWELLSLLLYLRTGHKRYALGLALLFALQCASGYPPWVLLGAGLCIGLFIAWTVSHRKLPNRLPRGWGSVALATAAITILLVAVQVLPLKEASSHSVHGSGLTFEEATKLSGSWRSLVRLVLPNFFGGNGDLQWSIQYGAHEEAASVGLLTAVLALAAPWLARRHQVGGSMPRAVPWLWCLMPVAALLALGANTPIYRWLFDNVVLFQLTRFPVRWLEVWAIAAALLAGFGFDGLLQAIRSNELLEASPKLVNFERVLWALAALALLLVVALILIAPNSAAWTHFAMSNLARIPRAGQADAAATLHTMALAEVALAALILAAGAWVLRRGSVALKASSGNIGIPTGALLVALIAADSLILFWRNTHTVPAGAVQNFVTWPAVITGRYQRGERWDTAVGWQTLNRGMLYGVDLYNGYDAMSTKRFLEFARRADESEDWTDIYQPQRHPPLLRVAGLTHTVATLSSFDPAQSGTRLTLEAEAGQWKLWRHTGAWPRIYVTRRLHRVAEPKQLTRLEELAVTNFKTNGQPAVVASKAFPDIVDVGLTNADSVVNWSRALNTMTAEVTATSPSLLVQSEALSPGWKAWVNGKPAPLASVNYLFRGVPVPAGKSRVVVVYDNQTFRFSMFLTLCGLAAVSGLGIVFIRRNPAALRLRRRPPTARSS